MTNSRKTFSDKVARVLPLLEDNALAFTAYVMGRPADEVTRHQFKWSKEGGLIYSRTGRYAGRFQCFGSGVGGDLIDFYAHYYLRDPKALNDALNGAMEWLGLSVDGPIPDASKAAQLRRKREEKRAADAAAHAVEDAKKSEHAASIIRSGQAVEGSPGSIYIRNPRAIPVQSFINAPVVWDAAEHALAFAATDDDGNVRALQHVAVTPAGEKDEKRYPNRGKKGPDGKRLPGAKNTVGPVSKGVVRFPRAADNADEYLIVGEGPETVWSANIAMGFEAWACLGGMSRAVDFAIGNRKVIVLRDDDGVTTGGYQGAVRAIRLLRERGFEVIEVWPFEQHRGNGEDFNTLIQESGVDTVRARIEAAIAKHDFALFEMPLSKVGDRLKAIVGEAIQRAKEWTGGDDAIPTVDAAGATVGSGKTEECLSQGLDYLIWARERDMLKAVVHAVPEHRLSDELADRFNTMAIARGSDLRAGVIRGRESINPDGSGEKMCRNIDDIREAHALAVSDVEKEVCERCPHHQNNGGACAYFGQRGADFDYAIVSHHMLFTDAPTAINQRGVGFVVIDEGMSKAGLIGTEGKGISIPLDTLMPAAGMAAPLGVEGDRLRAIREDLARVLMDEPDGYVSLAAIKRAGFDEKTAAFARSQETFRKIDKRQEPNWRKREANRDFGRMFSLWSIIDKAMNGSNVERLGHLKLRTIEGVRVLHIYGRSEIKAGWLAPTINIDALHSPDLLGHYYDRVEDNGFLRAAAPHQHITQVIGENWSKTYLVPRDGEEDTPKMRAKRRQAKAIVLRHAARIGGRVLLIGSKKVVAAIKATGLPSNIAVAHYNAVSGRDRWVFPDGVAVKGSDLSGVILLGAISPTAESVERMAGALTGRAPIPVGTVNGDFPKADAVRLLRRGKTVVPIPADDKRHPDETCEALRQMIVCGQIEQAVGRGRGVRRDASNPLKVVILSGAVLPFPVDELVDGGGAVVSHRDLMLAECGMAFEDGTVAAAACPDLYPSPQAARKALHDERMKPVETTALPSLRGAIIRGSNALLEGPIREPHAPLTEADHWGLRLSKAIFQRAGERMRPQQAWFDPALRPDPRAFIEAAIGPLARFEVVEGGEPIALPKAVGSDLVAPLVVEPGNIAPADYVPIPDRNRDQIPALSFRDGREVVLVSQDAETGLTTLPVLESGDGAIIVPAQVPPSTIAPSEGDLIDEAVVVVAPAGEVEIDREVWDAVIERARDAGVSMGEVAEKWCGVSLPHLSNMKSQRRGGSWKALAGLREFLMWVDGGGAKQTQMRLF